MNDKSLGQSTIKKRLMMLNKLKGTQNLNEKNKQQKKISAINPETDLNKFQVKVVSTDELMLSNADFHVKNLLILVIVNVTQLINTLHLLNYL